MPVSEAFRAHRYLNGRLKRGIDITIGSVGLIPTILTIGALGLAIKIDDGGDILFKQNRVGRNGKTFDMYKVRTFNNGEITRVGKLIRPLGIDELPQIVNILRGDMSIFGIRAQRPEVFRSRSLLAEKFPEIFEKDFMQKWMDAYLSVKPGVLPLAVAKGKSFFHRQYDDSLDELKEKMQNDIEQIELASLGMEINILLAIINRAINEIFRSYALKLKLSSRF